MDTNSIQKDISKGLANESMGVLPAGSTGRRYDPAGGVRKHNERIHRESKFVDDYKNLPFSFRKPPKAKGRNTLIACDNCGNITSGTTATVGIVCRECGKFSKVHEVEE